MGSREFQDDTADWAIQLHAAPLRTLEDKVHPGHTALVVIDVLNDFCAEGGMFDRGGFDLSPVQNMTGDLARLIEGARSAEVLVVFVRNVYSTAGNLYLSDAWLEMASRRRNGFAFLEGEACPPDSWQNDFYGDIRPQSSEPIVTKHRYSSFHNTDLELILRTHGTRTIIATGVTTETCVETAVREGFIRDFYMVVPRDAVATYSRDLHEASLRCMDMFFGQVVSVEEILGSWGQRQRVAG